VSNRPIPWVNYDAARVLDMLRGSYLFQDDPTRIIQDTESLRASYVRQGSRWEAWAHLRDDVTLQMNWSDHNLAIKVGASPEDSWELSTPWALRTQAADRGFGTAPTAAWQAFRKVAPLPTATMPPGTVDPPQNRTALDFIKNTPAATFYPGGPPMPAGH
jgi:hypothetical protein